MGVKTYDSKRVVISFGGYNLSGYADGEKVTVAYAEDAWSTQIGSDGEGTRSKSNNESAAVTIRLMQSSDSNQILSGLADLDRLSNLGALPLLIKDNSGTSLHSAETAWIQKKPDAAYGIEAGPREWVIATDKMIHNLGGN